MKINITNKLNQPVESRPCPKCGGKLVDRLKTAPANSLGAGVTRITECLGDPNRKGTGCGHLTAYFEVPKS